MGVPGGDPPGVRRGKSEKAPEGALSRLSQLVDLIDHNANRYPILPRPVISITGAVAGTATCEDASLIG